MDEFFGEYEPAIIEDLKSYGAGLVPGDAVIPLIEQEHMYPTFAINHVFMEESALCFNNPSLSAQKFSSLLVKCKELNDSSYGALLDSKQVSHRFHYVEPHKLKKCGAWQSLCRLWKVRAGSREEDELPDIYQFGLYTSEADSPRVLGFVGRWGIFYLLWFDVEHLVYPKAAK